LSSIFLTKCEIFLFPLACSQIVNYLSNEGKLGANRKRA
jgi:hypothetical protein